MTTEKGKLIKWIDDKGFGFIKPENGKDDIFIHISALRGISRKPIIGDVIHYEIDFDTNGQIRAVNAKIEGVSQAMALTPLKQKRKMAISSSTEERSYRKLTTRANKLHKSLNLSFILIAFGVGVFIYSKISKENTFIDQVKAPTVEIQPIEKYQCKGKVWCSEMSSYEEAMFYLHNCPGTKMDGDNDGIPCEQQF